MTAAQQKLGEAALDKIDAQEKLEWAREQLKKAAGEADLTEPISVHLEDKCLTISPPSYRGSLPIVKCFKRVK